MSVSELEMHEVQDTYQYQSSDFEIVGKLSQETKDKLCQMYGEYEEFCNEVS